jgi:hypothetical protein
MNNVQPFWSKRLELLTNFEETDIFDPKFDDFFQKFVKYFQKANPLQMMNNFFNLQQPSLIINSKPLA